LSVAAPTPPGPAVVLLTGDVMTGRGIDQVFAHHCTPELHESVVRDARDYVRLAERASGPIPAPVPPDYPWGDALAEMDRAAAAVRIVNLETAVTTSQAAWPAKGIHYRMHPANVDCLAAARIDCCVLANNHVLDWGRGGLDETLRTLRAAGLQIAGAGRDGDAARAPAALPSAAGGRVLVFAVATASSGVPAGWSAGPQRPGIAVLPDLSAATARALAEDVARHRDGADLVVVSIHWGGNWGLALPRAHREFAHRLVDLGAADIVHGHSSHHPLPIEVYRGRPILYGCGDLINDYEGIGAQGELRNDVACLYVVAMRPGQPRVLQSLDIVPFRRQRFRLDAADAAARTWLERLFEDGGRALGTSLAPRAAGGWTLRWDGAS
jgi:poly-gamma-glutamate synthesis protein (capsule biosynthesis protein)